MRERLAAEGVGEKRERKQSGIPVLGIGQKQQRAKAW